MATHRKENFIFYERKVRDDKEIESLLLENDQNDDDEENDVWVVQKSAQKLASTPNQRSELLNSSRSHRQSSSLKSPRKSIGNGIVSPIKIKRKLYVVNKVETPSKIRPDIVSPILIKRLPDSVAVIHSPSACYRKPTIELTSSEDEEEAKKSKHKRKNKKRPKSSEKCFGESNVESRGTRTSPKKRITYFEPPRKSKPSRLKLGEGEEQNVKRTPSRRCKLQQKIGEATRTPNSAGTPLKALTNGASSKTQADETPSKALISGSPSKTLANGTLSKKLANGTPNKTGYSPAWNSNRKRPSDFVSSIVAESRLSETRISRVLNALEAIESMNLSPSKCSVVLSKMVTPKSKPVGSSNNTPSEGSVEELSSKSAGSRRTPRRKLGNVFVDDPKHLESDDESDSSSNDENSSSNSPQSRIKRGKKTLSKTPSKDISSVEVGSPVGKGTPFKTPTKKVSLQSVDALSKADATPEKGCTPGKPVAKSMRSTPAKGTTPSKSTPAKPLSVAIPVSSSEDDEELATPLRRGYKRAAKSKPSLPPKSETPLKTAAITPLKTPVRRSARVSMSPATPSLRQKVLLANTPRSSLPPLKDESESEEERVTPRKNPKSAKKKLDLTPSSCRKVGHGFLSPVVAEREKRGPSTPSSDLDIARAQLQVSTLPKSLPCREKEFGDIKNFIIRKLKDGTGGCMYVSGVPGTGKTATVHTVVRALQKMAEDSELSAFDFVEVNGLRLTEPRQAYVRIWQGLAKNKVTPDQSLRHLETKFSGKPKRSTVLLVDELDYLCNRRQDVIYNILDWTTKRYSKLVVLTIANTMDLPERTLKGKVTSRMGLTRLVFQPYNFHQLEEIVLNRLDGCKAFSPDAVQLVARKVAAVSGDARRALDICRRSTEILELEGRTNVSVLDIQKVLTQIFAGSRVQAIKNCSVMAKLVLRAIKDEVLRTGVEETTIAFIHPQLVSICALEGKREPTITDLLAICSNLAESGLLFAEKGRKDICRKISLNVSTDDIHYAINC